MASGNGDRNVTVSELGDKLTALRWEMRAYVLLIVLGVLLKFQTPATSAARYALALIH